MTMPRQRVNQSCVNRMYGQEIKINSIHQNFKVSVSLFMRSEGPHSCSL
jgi:hypothetical protein